MDERLVWEVRWETQTPRGKWVAFVDAETQKVWNVYNEVRYLDGTLHAEHDIRTIGDGLTVSPLSELNVFGEEYRTDFDGLYSVADEEISEESPLTIWLDGRRSQVYNIAGDEVSLEVTGGEQVWTSTEETLPE